MTMMMLNNDLLYWHTEYDKIKLFKVSLNQLSGKSLILQEVIDISELNFGHNNVNIGLNISSFATFLRKENIKYHLDYYEKFVIVVIEGNNLQIIPFDWFNNTSGDYGYVWPATARLDETKSKLYCQGMRMSDFVIDLNNPAGKPF